MALSTRAKVAGAGLVVAAGVLGFSGYAWAGESDPAATTSYVTVVDDGTGPSSPSPREDCPDKSGSPTTEAPAADPGDA